MNDTQNISADDIALIRAADESRVQQKTGRGASANGKGARSSGKTARRKSTASASPKKSSAQKSTPKVDPDERLRQVLGVLLGLGGLLLFLALISYSALDQANTDVAPGELVGLLTNDPDIAARADTTLNWLGLLGAFFADFFLNSTIGWFALTIPVLLGFWSTIIFGGKDISKATRTTLFTLLVATLFSAILGTIRGISWTPDIPHEWSGAVGAFLATILTSLVGSVGSLLLLMAGTAIGLVYAFDVDMRTIANNIGQQKGTVQKITAKLGLKLNRLKSALEVEQEERQATNNAETTETSSKNSRLDEEPARMMRRMAGSDTPNSGIPEPAIHRPTPNTQANHEPTPSREPATANRNRLKEQPTTGTTAASTTSATQAVEQSTVSGPVPTTVHSAVPPPSPTGRDIPVPANMVAATQQEARTAEQQPPIEEPPLGSVTLTRAPYEEPVQAEAPKLTVHVEDGETDADLETEEGGELIDKLKDEQIVYDAPPIDLLSPQEAHEDVDDQELKTNARLLQEKLRTFNIEIEDLTVTPGPVVTLFEFVPAAGIKLSQIESLGDDIALALKARGIRIIAPIPGKGTVGVEIPNNNPAMVRIRSVLNTTKFREADMRLPLALGKTTVGEVFCADLSKMPHLLIAGSTGSGKSVGINSILASLIYKMHPSELKLAIIDPKKIELTQYRALIDHFLVSCPDIDEDIVTDPQNAVMLLKSLELEMDRRYDMLAKSGQRNIFDYNKKIDDGVLKPTPDAPHVKLPFIVLIIDELADLMITASKDVEEPIARLAQLARAIGIHMIVATQRPSVDVLTGMIKANFPARIAYQVATKIDSRTILDMNGAEQLLGNGDMLYLPGGRPKPLRLQNAFISTDEVEAVCEHVGEQTGYSQPYLLPSVAEKEKKKQGTSGGSGDRDDLFDEAAHLVVRHQQGSVSLIQRRLKVGYARAARIVDELEDAGIVGPFDGSKARAVLLESEAELEAFL